MARMIDFFKLTVVCSTNLRNYFHTKNDELQLRKVQEANESFLAKYNTMTKICVIITTLALF